jgi:hypothetical protein
MMKELDMSSEYEPNAFAQKSLTSSSAVTAMTPTGVGRPRGTAKRAFMAGVLTASLLTGAISFAAEATAKGQEGGVVCTGTQMASGTCQPRALQGTPIGSVPLGCQPNSGDTIACGRRGYHVDVLGAAQSPGSAVNGPTQVGAQSPASRHTAR